MLKRYGIFLVLALLPLLLAAQCGGNLPPTDSTPPAVPIGLSATAGNAQVILSWKANSEADLKHYAIYQGTSSGNLSKVGQSSSPSFSASGLSNGTTYFFAVAAEDNAGNKSEKSLEVSATPQAGPSDTTPPTVTAILPEDGSNNVALNTNITVTFSEPMAQSSTEAALNLAPNVSCSFSWNLAGTILTCNPASDLAASTNYTLTLSTEAEDLAGNALPNPFSSSFSTGTETLSSCKFSAAGSSFNSCTFGN